MACALPYKLKNNKKEDSLFKSKKGIIKTSSSASGAAVLLLLITVVLILYILFLPPEDRDALLQGSISGTPGAMDSHTSLLGTSVLQENPGRINYIKNENVEHDLSSFRIYTQTDAKIISEMQSIYVKNSAFEKKDKEMPFSIDITNTDEIFLSFNVFRPSGDLKIYVNGILLSEDTFNEGSVTPIPIPKQYLKANNIIYFRVSSPGFAFWRVNEYTLNNVRITGAIKDTANNFNMQKFYVEENEFENLEQAQIEFYPDCNAKDVNKLNIRINGNKIYEGIPDCGIVNKVTISKASFLTGENNLEFYSIDGSYIIDMVQIEVKLNEPDYPIYNFNLREDLFTKDSDNSFCGRVDGVCPSGCDTYEDKDCCYGEYNSNYWCDVPTENPRDRCVSEYYAINFDERCLSLYEDKKGEPAEESKGLCGDDTDGICPKNCDQNNRIYYDKDCCHDLDNYYWCDDYTYTGFQKICTPVVSQADCEACPNKYLDNDRKTPSCAPTNYDDGEEVLKADVDIILDLYFGDDKYKKIDFVINGINMPVDTYALSHTRIIDDYVRSGFNSIQIKPRNEVFISQIKVKIN